MTDDEYEAVIRKEAAEKASQAAAHRARLAQAIRSMADRRPRLAGISRREFAELLRKETGERAALKAARIRWGLRRTLLDTQGATNLFNAELPDDAGKRYPDEDDPMCGVPNGTVLVDSGPLTVTRANTVIEGKSIVGTVVFNAAGGVLRNCRVTASAAVIVKSRRGADFELDHCEIVGTVLGQTGFDGFGHVHHCRFTGCNNAINVTSGGAVIEWNDIHDIAGPSSAHKDGIQADGAIEGLRITNNRIDNTNAKTSAVMLDNYLGQITGVEVTDNFLAGGNYPAYVEGSFRGSHNATGIAFRRNVMRVGASGGYFFKDAVGTQFTRQGNVDWRSGAKVDDE